jgi:MGT family glycosyltransferase
LSHILICAHSNPGHVTPMLSIGVYLANLGHEITFHTAELFRQKVEQAGLLFVAAAGKANIDYRSPGDPEVFKKLNDLDRTNYSAIETIAEALPDMDRNLRQILNEMPVDLILTSSMYFGAFPLLLRTGENRPPVISCGVNPIMSGSVDCGPLAPPDSTPGGRERIHEANLRVQQRFAPMQEAFKAALHRCSVPEFDDFWLDAIYKVPDLFLQFSGDALEFPRSDMPSHLHFVGPILPSANDNWQPPAWWSELDGSRPVVLVTQGTLANRNMDELIQPALTALANDDVLVIVATGRPDNESLVVPANARVESFISFMHLLPKVDVMVTNGGFGAVQQCLGFGVPLIVCGESEDKAFTAVRVGWSGAGINLQTGHPTTEQLHTAVHAVLENEHYREQAQRIQKNLAQYDALQEMSRYVDAALDYVSGQRAAAEAVQTVH